MGDIDGDGVYDLIVRAGTIMPRCRGLFQQGGRRKGPFAVELARFQARRYVSRRRLGRRRPIDHDRRQHHRGLRPRHPGEVKIFRTAPSLAAGYGTADFHGLRPYGGGPQWGSRSPPGSSIFATGRDSIVTAPGPGVPSEVKVWSFPP